MSHQENAIKITVRYCFTFTRRAKIKNTVDTMCWGECGETRLLIIAVKWYDNFGKQFVSFLYS